MKTSDKQLMEQLLKMALKGGADNADVIFARGEGQSAECRLGKTESIERSDGSDIGLTIYIGNRTSSVSSSRIDIGSFEKMVERSVAMAKLAPNNPFAGLATSNQIANEWDEINMLDPYEPSPTELIDRAKETEDSARSISGVTNSDGAEASWGKTHIAMIASNGFYGELQRSSHSLSVSVIAGSGSNMETDYDYTATAYAEDMRSPEEVGVRAGKRAISRLNSKQSKTGSFPVVYDQRVSKSIAGHIASTVNGSSVARGTSMFQNDLNKKVLNSSINIVDDPKLIKGHGSIPFDGEGLLTFRRNIFKDGVLNGWLLDLASSRQLELPPTGNSRRGVGGPSSPGTSNFMILSGNETPESIRKDIKEGLLITQLIGSSVNMITGDYSRGASGFWIQNGEITYPVSEITVAGNLKKMFMELTPANDLDFSSSVIAPSLRIEEMMIAGN